MATIVYQKDKRSSITYAYESVSVLGQRKETIHAKRTLIGQVDSETGSIIPTDGRGGKKQTAKSLPPLPRRPKASFRLKGKRRMDKEFRAYDITATSGYSEGLRQVQYGRNKEGDPLAQLNLALVFGQTSHIPHIPQSIFCTATHTPECGGPTPVPCACRSTCDRTIFHPQPLIQLIQQAYRYRGDARCNSTAPERFGSRVRISRCTARTCESGHRCRPIRSGSKTKTSWPKIRNSKYALNSALMLRSL